MCKNIVYIWIIRISYRLCCKVSRAFFLINIYFHDVIKEKQVKSNISIVIV